MISSKAIKFRDLDPNIWKACAGSSVKIPRIDSRVYYFPQGYAEQAYSSIDFSSIGCIKPVVLCRVISVRFFANPDTDEVFNKIRLEPIDLMREGILSRPSLDQEEDMDEEEKVVSFSKVLTSSDANNGGGFSVPRFCADSIFPALDYKAEPPMQKISVRDVHGVVWEFRHIYRGTPRRHLLTTGWSKFVNNKKLISGDSVVFIKNQSGEISVGIRRSMRTSTIDLGWWNRQAALQSGVKLADEGIGEGFSRNTTGKVSAESVLEATELAGADKPFEIVCYPKVGSADFVVKADVVEASLNMFWTAGMRIKTAVETQDSSRLTWFQGTVSTIVIPDHGPWLRSPWRMLQVNWDEPEVLQNLKRVSPWEVELITTSSLQTPFPPTKKLRVSEHSELLTDGQGDLFLPMIGFPNLMMGHLNPSLFASNTSPAGMQGARHDTISLSNLLNSVSNNTHHMLSDHLYGNNMPLKLSPVSTELNIGGTSESGVSSMHSQGSVHSFGTEPHGNQNCNSAAKIGGSFRLFGKVIQISQSAETGSVNGGCTEDDVGRSCEDCPRVSAQEACSL